MKTERKIINSITDSEDRPRKINGDNFIANVWGYSNICQPCHVSPLSGGRVLISDPDAGTVSILTPSGSKTQVSPYKAGSGRLSPTGVIEWPGRGILVAKYRSPDLHMTNEEGSLWDTFPIDAVPRRTPSPFGLALFLEKQQFSVTHCDDLISVHDRYGVLVRRIVSPGLNWYSAPDEPRNRILVTDCYHHCVKIFAGDGRRLLTRFGKEGTGPGRFRTPHGVCTDSRGNIYVADGLNNRISQFSPDGQFISHVLDERHVTWPRGVTFDTAGRLVVAEEQKISCWSVTREAVEETTVNYSDSLCISEITRL